MWQDVGSEAAGDGEAGAACFFGDRELLTEGHHECSPGQRIGAVGCEPASRALFAELRVVYGPTPANMSDWTNARTIPEADCHPEFSTA